ncbi:unnamed protein product [Linum tenue]|uniref:Uncharacterized protein n=1 Tax=Linum tenue TaxID=586396 RepID=A0AAV0NKB8_9ROSI|nr:unnamed protein product [Linum tenue]
MHENATTPPPPNAAAPPSPMFQGVPPDQVNGRLHLAPPPPGAAVPVNPHNHASPMPWSTGLCDCFDDCSSCCLTAWCPCVAFGRIAEIVDRGQTSCGLSGTVYALMLWMFGCACILSCFYRSKMRGQLFLEESPCPDCLVHLFCEGWYGNMEKNRRYAATTAPAIEGGMSRATEG